ncbi:hypothetical protein ACFPZ0_00555 [Streptomonospora nanhaiensis]|uniref:Uncharacterized protein n=1 Tax=Streptomonospora nanhaiensis TaxID=1323731 RepID=A0A853BS95_9ACTN|nr:hypothetical protein [Streptomonospora nanhaiensis]MBV2366228.1 hypothetical protein [Streptomonospora nanhaiensis]MBX9386949.1 hypothetical protein [Streptomonospora nanhaiensis]NYI98258.1 hypothetical protein [Streptomonospora nanhaiensis]
MAWNAEEDRCQYEDAYRLKQVVGVRWLVMWGPGSRGFWAFHQGPVVVPPLSAPTAPQLHDAIDHMERWLPGGGVHRPAGPPSSFHPPF